MKWNKNYLIFLKDSLLALLVFCTISFLSMFKYLIPWYPAESILELKIGFPFTIYEVMYRGAGSLLGGWHDKNLLINAVLIWVCVLALLHTYRRLFKNKAI